jgi:acyl-CoA synthetase (NDP forming)
MTETARASCSAVNMDPGTFSLFVTIRRYQERSNPSRYRGFMAQSQKEGSSHTLSEIVSKELLAAYGLPLLDEISVADADSAVEAAEKLGFPVVLKLCGDAIAHKTERGLVRLRLSDSSSVCSAAGELMEAATPDDGEVSLLVAPMVSGSREFIIGALRDPVFGPTLMLGVGGIMAEVLADVVFRPLPVTETDALDMIGEIRNRKILDSFRGEAAVDRSGLVTALLAVSKFVSTRDDVLSVDVNPLIVKNDGSVVAVDALVEIGASAISGKSETRLPPSVEHFEALFNPKGVVVAGASSHPGKFGFVSLHNVLAGGYTGRIAATNLSGEVVLGIQTVSSIEELDENAFDLAFVCTPASTNKDLLRACAQKGIKAAFITSAGYGEAGDSGRQEEAELVSLANELDVLVAGPNGQGVVSTPAHLCAQIVAPYPPAGSIAVASQSGNFVSSFLNYSRQHHVGISRAVSAGNAAAVSVIDYLRWYSVDDATAVSLAYLEGISEGADLIRGFSEVTARKPLVVVKGGSTESGAKAAASHTGALAANDRVFDGVCSKTGVIRAVTVEEAFEAAATFATQPLPKGPNVVVLTTVGGWGVATADQIARDGALNLMTLPDDLLRDIDRKLPPRWSRNNPVDCAGGETRDTIPEVMEIVARHPEVHGVIYLGLGIQSNQARLMRDGGFYPGHGIERIVSYHEKQDQRFAQSAFDLSVATGKPILTATELAVADPDNPGPATVRATGRMCYPSGNRAATAMAHLYRYARFRGIA